MAIVLRAGRVDKDTMKHEEIMIYVVIPSCITRGKCEGDIE